MKVIPLRDEKQIALLRTVLEQAGQQPITVPMMRQRIKILDLLDEAVRDKDESLYLEDSDQAMLMQAIEAFPWATANRTILRFIDDVKEAQAMTLDIEQKVRAVKG